MSTFVIVLRAASLLAFAAPLLLTMGGRGRKRSRGGDRRRGQANTRARQDGNDRAPMVVNLAPFGKFLFLLRPKIVACTIAATVAGGAAAQAVSPSVVHTVRDMACAQEKERWQEAEMVDESLGHKPAYDVHHTVCVLQFVAGGRWHKIEYRHALHVSRGWGWSEVRDDSLSVMILQVEGIDVASDIYRWVMADRGRRGRVSFAVRDIFGGVSTTDHFYLPPEDDGHSGVDGCVGDACSPVGLQNRDQWQQLYELVFFDTLTRFGDGATRP